MASRMLVLPCALSPTSKTTRRGMSRSRRAKLRKLVRERCLRCIMFSIPFPLSPCRRKGDGEKGIRAKSCQVHFQFNLIAKRDAVLSHQRNAGLHLAGLVDRAAMNSGDLKAALLIKAKRPQVVVGRDQKEALTADLARRLDDFLDQGRADADVLAQAVERNDFTPVLRVRQRDQADHVLAVHRKESVQKVGPVSDTVRDDELTSPALRPELAHLGQVLTRQTSND